MEKLIPKNGVQLFNRISRPALDSDSVVPISEIMNPRNFKLFVH